MHAFAALVLALAGSTLAVPIAAGESGEFRLTVIASESLNGWAVFEAHADADMLGNNTIEIHRPSYYQPSLVHLYGRINDKKAELRSCKS